MAATEPHQTESGSQSLSRMKELLQSLESSEGPNEDSNALLKELYNMTRSKDSQKLASSLVSSEVALLGRYGFEAASPETRRLALRCLHNFMHQAPSVTQMFVDQAFLENAIDFMKRTDPDDEFLGARLVIICTNHSAAGILVPCLENGELAEIINANIARHARAAKEETQRHTSQAASSFLPACDATLNLLSLLTAKFEAQTHRFLDSLNPIQKILDAAPVQPHNPLEPPMSLLISCLVMLAYHGDSNTTREGGKQKEQEEEEGESIPQKINWPTSNAEKLIHILDLAIPAPHHHHHQQQFDGDPDIRLSPLVTLMLHVASHGGSEPKEHLKAQLLPSERDRTQVLGRGDSLPHRVVRMSTDTVSSEVKISLAGLLFELSDRDPRRLVDNVGYGCAVGLLNALGLPTGPAASGDPEIGKNAGGVVPGINPVTGQLLDSEEGEKSELPPMTEEEKEREAERLFVLFERLNRTGVVSVQNPVAAAVSSGRIQELPGDEYEDERDEGDD